MNNRLKQPAFTIIELLVAISISVIVIGFVNQMFTATTRAVTQGVQFGDVIANNRSVSERLYEDGLGMVAPVDTSTARTTESEAGMLVIFNRTITRGATGVIMPDPTTSTGTIFDTGGIRSDQLMFIKETGSQPIETFAPVSASSFAGLGKYAASYSKVWWGHVQRTSPDGSPSGTTLDTAGDGDPDYQGWQWILGRQELFLGDARPAALTAADASYNWYFATGSLSRYVNGTFWNSAVTGVTPGAGVTSQNWSALADASNIPLFYDPAVVLAGSPVPLVSISTGSGVFPDGLADTTYLPQAYYMLFPDSRLQVNDSPQAPYDSWRIAQMYPYIAQGVSDFIVEFAADAVDDVGITGFPDGVPDVNATTNEIIWYSIDNPPTFDASYTHNPVDNNPTLTMGLAGSNADIAFLWRHDYPDNWPYLIRIRYRLHDGKGVVRTSQDTALNTLTYTGNTLTYTGDETPQSGRWFELIIPVSRDDDGS